AGSLVGCTTRLFRTPMDPERPKSRSGPAVGTPDIPSVGGDAHDRRGDLLGGGPLAVSADVAFSHRGRSAGGDSARANSGSRGPGADRGRVCRPGAQRRRDGNPECGSPAIPLLGAQRHAAGRGRGSGTTSDLRYTLPSVAR